MKKTLSEKRSEWFSKWLQKKLTGRAIVELKQQDKEFIKDLKEEIKKTGNLHVDCCNECDSVTRTNRHEDLLNEMINKLAGKELIENPTLIVSPEQKLTKEDIEKIKQDDSPQEFELKEKSDFSNEFSCQKKPEDTTKKGCGKQLNYAQSVQKKEVKNDESL